MDKGEIVKKCLAKNNIFKLYYFENGIKIQGCHSRLSGDISGLSGDVSGLSGNVSGILGNISECDITPEDRRKGINITDLLME